MSLSKCMLPHFRDYVSKMVVTASDRSKIIWASPTGFQNPMFLRILTNLFLSGSVNNRFLSLFYSDMGIDTTIIK